MRAILQLHHGTSLISRLITWQTRSPVSHASVWFPDDDVVIESKEGRGVQQTPGASLAADRAAGRIQCFAVEGMTPELAHAVRASLSSYTMMALLGADDPPVALGFVPLRIDVASSWP
jgi:hypothetical protein